MKIKFNAKSNTVAAYCVIVFAICLLLTAAVFKYNVFLSYLRKLIGVLAPVIWGIVIAYLLNPIVKFTERLLSRFVFRKKPHPKISRAVGIAVSLVLLIGVMAAIIGSIVPEIISTIKGIFGNITSYLNNLKEFLNTKISRIVEDNPEISNLINIEFDNIQDFIVSLVDQYQPKFDSLLDKNGLLANLTDSAWTFLNGLKNFVLGIVVSIYLLYSRDTLLAQCRKIVYAMFKEKHRVHIMAVAKRANTTFGNFLSGKAIDSIIIGFMCFFGMIILNMRTYAVIIGVVVGVTNMIPFFGPFLGAIPSGLLILLTTPNKTLIFAVFILLLQQFDGNVLGPKILGESLGLSPFWVMFSIFVGGGMFGFVGMIAFVPLFAVVYSIFSEIIAMKLTSRNLPTDTRYYEDAEVEPPENTVVKQAEEESPAQEKSEEKEPKEVVKKK